MDILVNVANQRLKIAANLKNLIAGTQEFVRFVFNLDSGWDGLRVFAQFIQDGVAYNQYLDNNNSAYLPPEIQAGTVNILLYGTGGDTIATTNYLSLTLDDNILIHDAQSTEITQSLYQQLVNIVNSYTTSTDRLEAQIALKANQSSLTAEIQRAQGIESGLRTDVDLKATQADLEALDARVQAVEDGTAFADDIASAVDAEIAALLASGDLANMTIIDGSITRAKVNSAFEATLVKADNAMQPSVYDPNGYGLLSTPVDPYSFAQAQDTIRANAMLNSTPMEVTDTSVGNVTTTYSGLLAALSGVLNRSELYAAALLTNYSPFYIEIVDELPDVGADRTFYLIPQSNGSGYDKWWYIIDENNNPVWDCFGSSTTEVVSELPLVGEEDVDYILASNDEYQYYKYINNQWVLIAGSTAEILGENSNATGGYNKYMFGTGSPDASDANEENYNNGLLYLDTATMAYYTISFSSGTYSWSNGGTLVSSPSMSKDYFVQDINSTWGHFKYISNTFVQIGSSAYTRDEVDQLIADASAELSDDISDVASDVSALQTRMDNLSNMVVDVTINAAKDELTISYADGSSTNVELDTGTDIDSTAYNIEDDQTLHFYDSSGNELEDLAVVITGGGGGGGASGGTASIGRVTASNVQCVYGDDCTIEYTVTATDASGDAVGNGVGTLYINNVAVETGFEVLTSDTGETNSIEVGDYLTVGSNSVKISVSVDTGGESNTVATKTWTVNAINMYFTWNYSDSQINTSAATDYYTPYGALSKTIYTFIDVNPIGFNPEIVTELPDVTYQDFDPDDVIGINYFVNDNGTYTHYVYDSTSGDFVSGTGSMLDVNTTTRSGVQQALTIPMQTHGSHTIVRYMIGVVNGEEIKTAQQVHDMVFVVAGTSTPVISVSFNTGKMTQYNTVQIPIVVYDPNNTTTTVSLYEGTTLVSTWTGVDRTVHYWNYSPTTYGTKTLTIGCGAVTKSITIEVEELDIDEAEVTGYDFRFKASEMATNASVQEWSNTYTPVGSSTEATVDITFSNNFDWVNGGLHTETDEDGHIRQYFCVRAGTTMTINYNLFGQAYDPKQYGKNFKFIFKAVNCRTYDGNVLTCMDTSNGNNGVGLVMTANEATLYTANNSIKTYYCKDSYIEFETNIHPTSEYRYLQFWMDGSHDVTKLYDVSDGMQQVAPVGITIGSPNCDVYVYMIKAYPVYLTNNNELSNFIMDAPNAYQMVDRYNRNDILNASGEVDYQKLANANPDLHVICLDLNRMTTGKKDNVVAYTVRHIHNGGGESDCFTINNACVTVQGTSSVGYLESAGNVDINFKYNRTFTSDNVSYTTSAITFDDGTTSTSGYSMSENSIAVDYLNVKLNVASSENANNACIADWYNTYQPWLSPVRKKKSKARDTMEFVPGVIFIRDRSGNLFTDTSGYHFYGICDIGNSKKNTKVFHDTSNPIACCVEVSNNTSLPCLMSDDNYTWDDDEAKVIEDGESVKVYEFRYVNDDTMEIAKSAWDRFAKFFVDHNPNLATGNAITSTTFGAYTFKGSGSYDTSAYDSDDYDVVYLYGYGLPTAYNGGIYTASDYVTDTSNGATCYYYINYSNNYIYSSNGTTWTAIAELTWTADRNNVLAGTTISTYAGTYTTDSFNYRMAYILEHCEEYLIIDPTIFHFIFIESFLMTDNVAKNTFWSSDDLVHWEPSKDYDNDTALGNDNVGGLSFTYGLETDDIIGNSYVFNAHDAAWITFARGLFNAGQTMYRNRESAGCFNTSNFLAKVKAWQDTRPERVWVADAQRKYLRPYEANGTVTYIPMLAGKKTHQREQVKTYNSYYYASKYVSDFCTSQNIMVRGNTPTSGTSITVVPPQNKATLSMYINCYIVVASTSYNVVAKTKATRGQTYEMDFSSIGSMGETELYFCTAPMITELSGLAHLYFKQNNFGMATNLQRLEVGSGIEGYENPNLENLTIGNNKMLEYLDVRNCPNATGALDLSGCVSLSEIYLENTAFTGITFATGGLLEIAHLPSPTALTLRDLIYLEDLTIGNIGSLATLRAEDCIFANDAELTIGSTTTTQATKDIILNLVESSPNLSRVRLIGLDWTLSTTDTLDDLLNMAGIDDDSYDVSQSVLTGQAYVPTMRSGLYDLYTSTWQYLTITYSTMVAQYLATFVNADGSPILDRNGNAYKQWVDSGSAPYDPITMGYTITISGSGTASANNYDPSDYNNQYYLDTAAGTIYKSNGTTWDAVANSDILTPTMSPTAQYIYTFSGWDDIETAMSAAKTITAQYSTTTRTYTVTWWRDASTSLEIQSNVVYGSDVDYSGSMPTWTNDEGTYTFRLFKGWDKSTGFITGDTNVYAIWDVVTALPSVGTDMKDMSLVQIYAVGQAGFQSSYWEDQDYFDIILGHDFDFTNVEDCVIGTDVTLTGITVDQYVSGGYYFDGSHAFTTNIGLFSEDAPAFTMAIDFQFSNNTTGATIVSTHEGGTAEGFRLYHNGNNPVLQWGDQSVVVGNSTYRDIVVIRHPKASRYLYVYSAGNTAGTYATDVTKTTLLRTNATQTDEKLTFGAVNYGSGGFRNNAKGHIHWCKIWYDDIGDTCAKALAVYPHEKVRFEYWGAGKYYYYNSANVSKASFICNSEIGQVKGRGYYMNSGNTNAGGWDASMMRSFCNGRVFDAMPTELQAMIKAVEINTTSGSKSTSIITSEDKIYLQSYRELGASTTDAGYISEVGTSINPISWFTSNPQRVKFKGKTRKYSGDSSVTIYTASQEPAVLYQTDINQGDIWIHSGNSNIGYIFLTQTELDHYGITADIAADSNYASGGWISASTWWERSPGLSTTTGFYNVGSNGALYDGGASYVGGVVPSFSF